MELPDLSILDHAASGALGGDTFNKPRPAARPPCSMTATGGLFRNMKGARRGPTCSCWARNSQPSWIGSGRRFAVKYVAVGQKTTYSGC